MNKKKITYILAEFPSYTETFILKEVLFINRVFPLYIIVLNTGTARIAKNEYKELESSLIYINRYKLFKYAGIHLVSLLKDASLLEEWKDIFNNLMKINIIDSLRKIKLLFVSSYISRFIKQKSVAHIHSHFANYPTDIVRLVSKLSGIPFSFSAHANDIYVNPQRLIQKINDSKFVTTCTLYNKKWLENLIPSTQKDKIHLVYHGVDLGYWKCNLPRSQYQKTTQILFIGRLVEKKGVIYLLEAIKQLKDNNHLFRLVIVGKGKEERTLKNFCRVNNLSENVTFLSWQSSNQIRKLFASSDILVLPSIIASDGDRDGIPNVILEAMAVGLPVISTSVSGITEIIRDRYNGLFVPQRNVKQLADSILALTNNDTLRKSISNNGLTVVAEKFDDKMWNSLLENLFKSNL